MNDLMITPKTKISDIFTHYPQLEDVFLEMAPAYKKQTNPTLRETIFKVTTLAQAAIVGGAKVEEMVQKLRQAIGQNQMDELPQNYSEINNKQPDWFDENLISKTIDTREMLGRGEHPVHEVLSAIKNLSEEAILKVIVPFIPAPMIEKATSLNHKHWLVEQKDETFWLYFSR